MTLCQHGVQTDAGYECSACVTTSPHPIRESLALRGLDAAADYYDKVLQRVGPPPGWRSEASTGISAARSLAIGRPAAQLRAYLEDARQLFLESEASAIFEALDEIDAYVRGER